MSDELERRETAEAVLQVAQTTRAFFLALVAEGFTEQQALSLTATWLGAQMGAVGK